MKQAIIDCAKRSQRIHYANVGIQSKMRTKDEEIAFLKRSYVGYHANEDKNNVITIIAKSNEATESLYIYLYPNIMVIEGTRSECCWHVIKIVL